MSGAEYPVPVPVVALMGMDEMHAQIEEHISKVKSMDMMQEAVLTVFVVIG